ncbi:S-layer homology domain-containing protein [Paenibacillus macquariensis]|uniref:S-layer homology domain-containing protein n=1 Tax=Paenibacillus macquariensis TaxID=948756 RepID=A0ABY1KAD1_9BACL|nr:S-layer homology domain-containing protein [Paenibacillus macquariensis]MEC0093712.1 S-layer homology domain-containing protein [Paenibacillus macquariensis]OAB31659.1 hypothetical protein PMSM_19500 [Paenibacillus macquariensis subsp. macquariensis]SIR50534.1 S-layer homology domain-containing protein [Paenibacillus macquariensis]
MLRIFKKAASIVLVLSLILSVFPQFIFANGQSSSKEFLSFSVEDNLGNIDNVNHTINVEVPFNSAVDNMLEIFTVSEGASVPNHISGVKRTDYTNPVILTVVAEDGSKQDYTVTVTIGPSNIKSIKSFDLSAPVVTGFIDDEAFAIFLTVPQGTNVTALKPTFITDESAAKVKVNGTVQDSGVSAQNFTQPLIYTVEALDGSTRNYTVTVNFQRELSTAKEITYFGLASLSSVGIIDEINHKIALTVPFGTNLASLAPAFTSTGTRVYVNQVQQISGEAVLDFRSLVDYVVYDEVGDSQVYTVTVQVAAASSTKEMLTFAVAGTEGTVNEAAHTISVVLPARGSLLNQTATFTTNGQSVKIGNEVQYSGRTLNDFTSPLTYTVISENGLTQNYVVTTVVLADLSAKVISVSVPANGTYTFGQALDFGVAFDQAVSVDTTNGTPSLWLVIGIKSVRADYLSGSGSNTLTFRYTVQRGDSDLDGITVGALDLNRGTIKDSVSNTDASLTLNSVGSTAGVLVNAPVEAATVSTNPVTNVTSTSANVGGDVTSDGDSAVTVRGIVFSTSSDPTIADMKVVVAGTTGSYTSNLTGLAAETTYHVRAFATNSVGTSYGNDVSFTTTLPSSVATVSTTDPVTNVTATSADVGGDITSEGGAPVTVRGIVYSTTSNPTLADKQIVVAGTTGSYTSNLGGLVAGTTYYVRAFATNSVGTSYGNDVSFTTLSTTPPIATVIAMSLNKHTGTMQVGDTFTVVATATMSDTTTQDITSLITWTADDPSKVSIHNGVITALKSGSVTIEAKYSGTSVIVDHINLNITNPYIPGTGTGTGGTPSYGTNEITVEKPPAASTPPIFPTGVNIAKVISELTKKLEDSKGVSVNFNDTATHWADKTVKLFTKLGVVKGYEDGSFRPNDSITRGEFASIIFRVFGLTGSTSTNLSDGKGHWAEDAIIALSSSGIISGYEDGTFKPDRQITRAEIISIISKLVVLKTTSSQGTFKDIDGVWNKDQIQAAASMGLVNGQSTDHFAPQSNATRAEALTIILHALELDSGLKSLFEQ